MTDYDFELFRGDGVSHREEAGVPLFNANPYLDDPKSYITDRALRDAVNVALALGQPLLLAGEPGTGKTQFAATLAAELGAGTPLMCSVKTNSTARDLFYRYDSLRHFHDSQSADKVVQVADYVTYEALGLAILLAMASELADPHLPPTMRGTGPKRSVVLLDEIDKAPRDLPNDVLNEIDQMTFRVPETGETFSADSRYRPILVLTSNSEKNLPDAFLRRCVFHYISFPDSQRLREIVSRRLAPDAAFSPAMVDAAIEHFEKLRSLDLAKRPATAEFLAWMQILSRLRIDVSRLEPGQAEVLAFTYATLAKSREDLELMREQMDTTVGG